MKVSELIDMLSAHDPDFYVCFFDFNTGYLHSIQTTELMWVSGESVVEEEDLEEWEDTEQIVILT